MSKLAMPFVDGGAPLFIGEEVRSTELRPAVPFARRAVLLGWTGVPSELIQRSVLGIDDARDLIISGQRRPTPLGRRPSFARVVVFCT